MCSCPLGMELGPDNHTCQIQSYCAKHLKCSQKCDQNKFSVKCSCYEGWVLEPDGESCRSLGETRARVAVAAGAGQAEAGPWLWAAGCQRLRCPSGPAPEPTDTLPPLIDRRNAQTCREFS